MYQVKVRIICRELDIDEVIIHNYWSYSEAKAYTAGFKAGLQYQLNYSYFMTINDKEV